MKKITLGFSILALAGAVTVGCKKTNPTAPVADTEVQTAKDASWAFYSFTDAEQIAAFISDNTLNPTFYLPAAGSLGTTTPVQDTTSSNISFGFNTTTCLDGRYREGSVQVDRLIDPNYNPHANPNSKYYRMYGYSERLTFSLYKIDGWQMTQVDKNGNYGQPILVVNNMSDANWNPAKTNLSWTIKGSFKLQKDNDSMQCNLDIVKTLVNTSVTTVFDPSKSKSINWSKAIVSYSGKITGYTSHNVPFTMNITPDQALTRDFTCAPNVVGSVSAPGTTLTTTSSQYHPFIGGIATFTTGTAYPRQIFYAGSEASLTPPCDNSGAILIKGIYYPVDFRLQ